MVLMGILFSFLLPGIIYRISKLHIAIKDIDTDWTRNILQHNVKGAVLFGEGNSFSFYTNDGIFRQMTPTTIFRYRILFVNYALHYFGWIAFILFLAIYVFL